MDAIVFGKTGIPDIRCDTFVNPFNEIYGYGEGNQRVRKSFIMKKLNGEDPYEERERIRNTFILNKYMEKPDWAEPHKKMLYAIVAGVKLSILSGGLEILNMKSKQPKLAMWLAAKNTFFMGGSAIAYGAVTCAVANLRGKKDDIWNHAAGGASLGLICGFSMKSSAKGSVVGFFGACCGMLLKAYYVNDRPGISDWYNGPRELRFMQGHDFYDFRTQNFYAHTMFDKQRSEHYNI